MNLGARIDARLGALGWKRSQLLAKAPELTPQALSNLIVRDSKRSEWDLAIAEALGVDVLWLVYGIEKPYPIPAPPITLKVCEPPAPENDSDLREIIYGFRVAEPSLKQGMAVLAREAIRLFEQRSEKV